MLTEKWINYLIILFFICERLLELFVNQRNKVIITHKYFAKIKYPHEAQLMRLFHVFWFLFLIVETSYSYDGDKIFQGWWSILFVVILVLAQSLRWYAIYTLGIFWSVDIYEMDHHPIITKGPYAYMKHPNYFAVMTEFIFLPILLKCFYTLIVGLIVNVLILRRRIFLEEQLLTEQSAGVYANR